ncbi:uncharacterized protein LOC756739 [Strongylocentrotus purpuratus]|uniref:BRCT domain-containing protein n=1 Tax=Strongylocentrotus purpuratus TaxID=7668 RepID=A0A7M7NRA2_STRPU|nr:uncharacterized protein LOC756739 [Strongylocentrotus purpuratus]
MDPDPRIPLKRAELYRRECESYYECIFNAKSAYLKDLIKNADTKELFRLVKTLSTPTQSSPLPDHSSDSELANRFATFFREKVAKVVSSFPNVVPAPASRSFAPGPHHELSDFCLVSLSQVRKLITSLPSKHCKLDPIPTWLLKEVLDELLPHITKLFNLSLSSGIVPESFKTSLLLPLLKKPSLDTNGLKNYRPIANLPFLGKVLERIVSLQLKAHIDNLGLFPIHQSAYRNHHSTETATVKVLNDLLLAVDKGNEAVLILLDYTAAFDTINHDLLLHRLENDFSITGTVLQWICSYLMHRTQKVIINDTNSESFPLICGVPQGSVTSGIPHTPSLIPDTPSFMKPCLDLLDSIKKGQGSAHRRLSITNSPNISPSTPLRQRLLHCFTEEANSCTTESPSTSVKLHKSGPVRRPNSRRELTEEDVEMEIDTPSAEMEVKSRGRGRRSTASNSGVKLTEGGEVKVGTTAEVATSNKRRGRGSGATPSGTKLEAGKVGSPSAEESGNRRSRRSIATPRGTTLTEEGEGTISKPVGEVAATASSRGRGRSRGATPRGTTSDVGGVGSHRGEPDKPTLMENNSSSAGDDEEQKKGKGRRDISLKRKLSLDSEGSSSQDRTSGLKRKRCSRSKASNETVTTAADRSDTSEMNDVCIVSTGICGTDEGTRSSIQETKSSRLQEVFQSSKNGSASKRKRPICTKDSDELLFAEKWGDSGTGNAAIASTSTCGTGGTRSSSRRRSCLPALPVQPSTEDGQMDQTRRRSNRRKSVASVVNQPSLADHLNPMGVQSTGMNSVPGKRSSVGRTKGVAKGLALSDVAFKEEEEGHHPKKKQKSCSRGSLQKSLSPGGSQRSLSPGGSQKTGGLQKSTFDGVKEEPAKFEEKENQNEENVLPKALGQRIGSMNENDGRKRKLLSPLPTDLTCSSILSSIEVQNRPSIEEFKLEGSIRHRAKRSTLKKDSVEAQLCTSSEDSVVSSEDLDDTRKETKGKLRQILLKLLFSFPSILPTTKFFDCKSTASKEKKKKRKKVTLSDSITTSRKKKSTIVMTSLHRSDQEIVLSVVKDLGSFEVTDSVCETTTHVVVGENRRTLNVLSGIARGSWILSMDWVYRSIEAGSWLPEEPYEMNVYFPGAMISRLAHGAKSDSETSPVDIFSSCATLYIPPESNPPRERLLELVELCGGHISRKVSDAKLCVGGSGRGKKGSATVVAEKWILDCITRFKLLPWDPYKVNKS